MTKYVLLGLALVGVNCLPAAKAADSCPSIGLNNGQGTQQVVYGQTLNIIATGLAPLAYIYLDGSQLTYISTTLVPAGNLFTASVQVPNIPYGNHTLKIDWDPCVLNFSNTPVPATPGTPTLSTNRSFITSGGNYTLSWTVPSGSINHYTLHKVASGGIVNDTTYPSNSTAVTLTGTTPAGTSKILTYTLHACSTADESSCGSWSNAVQISIDAPCVGRCP